MVEPLDFDRFMQHLYDHDAVFDVAGGRHCGEPYIEIVGQAVPGLIKNSVNAGNLHIRRISTVAIADSDTITADHEHSEPAIHGQFYISRSFRAYDGELGEITKWEQTIFDDSVDYEFVPFEDTQ